MLELEKYYFKRSALDPSTLVGENVSEKHYRKRIDISSVTYLEGNLPVIYLDLNIPELEELQAHLELLEFSISQRTTLGPNNYSILFGAVPASINRSNFCNYGAVAGRDTELHNLLFYKYSTVLNELLKQHLPSWQKVNSKLLDRTGIHSDYKMPDTIWTSGIINKNSPQNYHYDDMNVKNMISGMITLKKRMSGGYLVFPEYEIAFEVKNRSIIFFCGKSILHGVSPLKIGDGGSRHTIVYYTTQDLSKCKSSETERRKAVYGEF